jgi:two-component sensor histidine kinase
MLTALGATPDQDLQACSMVELRKGQSPSTVSIRTPRDGVEQFDFLDRLAQLSDRVPPYSATSVAIGLVAVAAGSLLRLIGWGQPDLMVVAYLPTILAAGLLAGTPTAVGVTLVSILIIWFVFAPSHLQVAALSNGILLGFAMYLIAALFTIYFAHCCRIVLRRLNERNRTNELLTRELQHRNRNIFTIIEVIVQKTLAADQENANKIFRRIRSIMYANDRLTGEKPQLLTLTGVLLQAFEPYGGDRIVADGLDLILAPDTARNLILLINELVTNAAKHGALSNGSGRVFVRWRQDKDCIALSWKEVGGPTVTATNKQGFGSQLIAASVKALSGAIHTEFSVDGFTCSLIFPLSPLKHAA